MTPVGHPLPSPLITCLLILQQLVRTAPAMETRWLRPTEGIIKINFDASFKSDTTAARFGMVARDHEGLVLAAAANFPVLASSTVLSEALAFRWSISLVI